MLKLSFLMLFCLATVSAQTGGRPTLRAEEAFSRAIELQRQNQWDEAVIAWRAFLKLEPHHAGAHANLGTALSRLNQYEDAVKSFETALRLNPGLTPLFYNLGVAHFRAGRHAEAAEALRRYLNAKPDFQAARQLLGLALVELGNDAEAVAQLETTLAGKSFSQEDAGALYALGLAYVRLRRTECNVVIAQLAALPAGKALSKLLAGQVQLRESNYKFAVEEFEAAAKLDAELPRLHYSLGVAYLRSDRKSEAAQAFQQELRRRPRDFWTLYHLAYLQEAEGQIEAAKARLKAALEIDPRSTEANALLGKILLRQSQAAAAVAPLEIAVAGNPNDSNTRFMLGRAYQQSGRGKDAAREFAEVQRLKKLDIEKERDKLSKPK